MEEDLRGSMLRRIVGAAMLEYIEGLDVEKNLRRCLLCLEDSQELWCREGS